MSLSQYRLGTALSDFIGQRRELLIDGVPVDCVSGASFEVLDPSTGAPVAVVAEAGAADVDRAVVSARRAFDGEAWRGLSPSSRGRILSRAADLLEDRGEDFAQLDALDGGIPISASRALVAFCVDFVRYMAGLPTKIEGSTLSPAAHSPSRFASSVLREPLGVVGQIVPWNAPLLMAVEKVAPALATGNTVVLKPAEQTPLSALRLGQLFGEAGLPAGVLNVVPGYGPIAGAALVSHPAVDKISFTGSTEVGKKVAAAAADNLIRVSLELGGKSPNIVFADADLGEAIRGSAAAIFAFSGQNCAAGSRLFVEESVFDEVVAGVCAEASRLRLGPPLDESTGMGPLISASQRDRVAGMVDAAVRSGTKVAAGGRPLDGPGYFMQPTVLTGTTARSKVEREEIFGPVVVAIPFRNETEVVRRANETAYGLAAGVWTGDVKRAHRLTRDLRAGVVWINCYNMFDPALPFGGVKSSGWGRENGLAVVDLYTQTKTVTTAF